MNTDALVEKLGNGGIIAYPTETIWGLGVDATNKDAVEALRNLKGREQTKSMSVLVRDTLHAKSLAEVSAPLGKALDIFWPGAVTFVLPAKDKSVAENVGGADWIGLRCSSHDFIDSLVWAIGKPIVTTSANRSGDKDPASLEDLKWLPPSVLVAEGVESLGSASSTVLRVDGEDVEILRQGALDQQIIQNTFDVLGFSIKGK